MFGVLLAAAIQLTGVTGNDLRARAFFDANNVKVGDPLVLTVDFLGEADFKDLHPPALSKFVDRKDWKLDDASAKTDTYRTARRLTYRIRPMREGVLWFPALEFEYVAADGSPRTVRANEIPVHAKIGAQVVVSGMEEDRNEMPQPPQLASDPGVTTDDDTLFAWRKACANPTADAFAAFDFPQAKMNEATCAILAGNWARAMAIYRRLEWRIGQTEALERGLLAALALRYDNPRVELPVWRQVLRPLLRFDWRGRVGLVTGGLALLAFLFWLIGRGIRAAACLAFVLALVAPRSSLAQGRDPFASVFEQMERMHQQMQQQMRQVSSGFGGLHFGEKEQREPVVITASAAASKDAPQVGEDFDFIVSIEAPKTATLSNVRMVPSETFGLTVTGSAENLPDAAGSATNRVVKRLSVPVRYDVPFKGRMSFTVSGMVTSRETRGGGRFSYQFSNSFECDTKPFALEVKPLPSAGQPEDFSGIVSEGMRLHELCDLLTVETNDVVTITYRMYPKGYVPVDYLPRDTAFEWGRQNRDDGKPEVIEYRRFFVADGAEATPKLSLSYYDPRTRNYRRLEVGGTPLKYIVKP